MSTNGKPIPVRDEDRDRIMRFTKIENGCWIWTGRVHRRGYPEITIRQKYYRGNRFSYTLFKGEIPPGMVIDHLCRNPLCMNPRHLEAVTQKENMRRGNVWKTA